ncbi:cdc42 homolog [Babylonia areolata]|uniref:cdc42 homolog n=1 Tax=Babylonia areolata TaxID=304850 RepID=UPI003FD4DD88
MKSDSVTGGQGGTVESGGGEGGEGSGEKFVHCAMLGDGMVGKTCLTLSYTQHLFTNTYTATVFDNYSVPLKVGGQDFVISLFDTAGQSDYESVRAYTYQESEVLVLCFSVCDRESFCSVVNSWLPEIRRHTKRRRPLLLVGTQIDLRTPNSSSNTSSSSSSSSTNSSSSSSSSSTSPQDQVSTEEGRQLAKLIGADCYIECSARSQEGLQQVFEHVVFSALKYRKKKSKIFSRLFGDRTLSNKSIRQLASKLQDGGKGHLP